MSSKCNPALFYGVKKVIFCFVISIVVLGLTDFEADAKSLKIGIIDFQKILSASSAGKLASEIMNKKGKEMEDDIKARESELMELQKKLERESLVMGKDKSEEKQRELRIKANDLKSLKNSYVNEFKELQAQHFNRIKNEVLGLTREMGAKEGFTMIIERNESGVMYLDDSIDITDKVIDAYNKAVAAQ
ncbi:MAG: OmpH family outer membrane protein [Desulfamplus sp.]|nr:OmpH family outer membrane protein [Desulfamplus sp.]